MGRNIKCQLFRKKVVSDLLHHLDLYKVIELDGIYPRVLRGLEEELTESLSIIYQQSWVTGWVPVDPS